MTSTSSKASTSEPKDRRRDVERRIRYAIRKANDRMFAPLQSPAEQARDATSPQRRS